MPELRKPGEASADVTETKEPIAPVDNGGTEKIEQQIKEQGERSATDFAKVNEEVAALKFEREFDAITNLYPYAKDVRDKISEKVKSGIPLADAAVIVLNAEGKLMKRDEVEREEAGRETMGGSSPTFMGSGANKAQEAIRALNTPGTISEEKLLEHQNTLREAVLEEERKGNIKWTAD